MPAQYPITVDFNDILYLPSADIPPKPPSVLVRNTAILRIIIAALPHMQQPVEEIQQCYRELTAVAAGEFFTRCRQFAKLLPDPAQPAPVVATEFALTALALRLIKARQPLDLYKFQLKMFDNRDQCVDSLQLQPYTQGGKLFLHNHPITLVAVTRQVVIFYDDAWFMHKTINVQMPHSMNQRVSINPVIDLVELAALANSQDIITLSRETTRPPQAPLNILFFP